MENKNNNNAEVEKKDSGIFSKNILAGIGAAFGITTLGIGGKYVYDKYNESEKSDIKDNNSVLKYQGTDDRDQLLLKLKKQKSLKPKIINDEYDKNYIRANSIIEDEEEKEKKKLFTCPISQKIMEDPVITPYGTTYERSAILNWIEKNNNTDYISKKKLTEDMLITNYILKTALKDYNESLQF